jgi:hypothetical protein
MAPISSTTSKGGEAKSLTLDLMVHFYVDPSKLSFHNKQLVKLLRPNLPNRPSWKVCSKASSTPSAEKSGGEKVFVPLEVCQIQSV